MTDGTQAYSLRESVWLLREFEGRRCLWRLAIAAAAYATTVLLPLAGAVAGIYIGADLTLHLVVLGVVVSLGSAALAGLLARRKPWREIFTRRLGTYLAPSPTTTLEVLIQDEDSSRAHHVLRRAQFVPMYSARLGVPPHDATDLTTRIGVQEPVAWMRSTSDEDRAARVAAVFDAAGLRARVAGRDVLLAPDPAFPNESAMPPPS